MVRASAKLKFEDHFGFIPTPLVVFDRNTRKALWANEAARDLLKLNPEQIENQSLGYLFDFKSVQLSNYSAGGEHFTLMWLNASASPIDMNQEARQKELIHLSRLADVGRLSAGIAHELNNPLMLIQGYAENMGFLIEEEKLSPDEMSLSIRQILKSIARMAKIISGIQRFVRNDDFSMVKVDLNEIIPEASELFRSKLQSIEAEIEIQADIPRIVKCDPAQIEQIIVNIMNNAFHALEEIPDNRKIRIGFTETEETLTLSIWNNGPEVPLEIREKIMSPFFTTKKVGEGTGLGLSVSYGIMKSHNGDLRFESAKGKGTCFYLDFPKLKPEIENIGGQGKVLVVDGETSFTWMLANKLRLYGFEVLVAETAAEAIKLIENDPDILGLFANIHLNDMQGIELTRNIRKAHGSKHQIFLLNAYPLSFKEELAVKRAGIDDLISKPIPVEKLSAAARLLIDHKNSQRALGKKAA